ncbi:MAG: DUF4831 family protein [Bacteroidales bacterium]|nr:DUF4831 family protein [Bacteroidales bacterium]
MKKYFSIIVFSSLMVACAVTKNETVISQYRSGQTGQSALVYGLPQTRLYFDVELVKTVIKKGPYAEYAAAMLGLQDVPAKDSESWQISYIRISDKQEVDNKQLYALSFIDYPYNIDRLLRFTEDGLLLDISADHVLINSRRAGKSNDDIRFPNTVVKNIVTERVDTVYQTVLTDTSFVRIPVLQRKVLGKTTEEQAREAANQIFDIRQGRLDVIKGNIDHSPDGSAMKLILDAFNTQEEQLLSLFNGVKVENRYVYTYSALPAGPGVTTPLFYFSDKTGIVKKNTPGAGEVWYKVGEATVQNSAKTQHQASNIIYYRIPQIVEISTGLDGTVKSSKQARIYQFGNIVSFPLLEEQKKK